MTIIRWKWTSVAEIFAQLYQINFRFFFQNFEVLKKSIIDGSYRNAFVEKRKAAHNIDPHSLCNNSLWVCVTVVFCSVNTISAPVRESRREYRFNPREFYLKETSQFAIQCKVLKIDFNHLSYFLFGKKQMSNGHSARLWKMMSRHLA